MHRYPLFSKTLMIGFLALLLLIPLGIRATAAAAELSPAELLAGRRRLARKVARYRPAWVAVLGVGAYRTGFRRPDARLGRQPERLAGAGLWVLPNPSGLNAHHQPRDLALAFAALRRASTR